MITGVPRGVGAIDVLVNGDELSCLQVTSGHDQDLSYPVWVGDSVSAVWHSGQTCTAQLSLNHHSWAHVNPSSLTNFWFDLSRYQID